MDKAVLKKFAIESRQDLMQRMENKIKAFYIDEEFSKQQSGDVYILANSKHSLNLSKEEYNKRELLIKRINDLGLEQVIEEAAYTWFNRIVAIRYMEIHDYLPLTRDNQSLGIRVLSSKDNTPDPEIMKFTNLVNPELDIDFKKEKYVELKDDNEKFKYILLLVCRKLGRVIPQVFDGMTDYIDILIPDNLLNESGFVNKIITEVPIENYEQVEIIGWLYQYYVAEKKKKIDEKLNSGAKISKDELPTKTQLFTPDVIVKYMVDNCSYISKIEDIKIIDPCCGSGHILVIIFDKLFKEYIKMGYSKNLIATLILEKNIFGADIDRRAVQLTELSLLLKAREYDNNIFKKELKLNLASFEDSKTIKNSAITFLKSCLVENTDKEKLEYILNCFNNSNEIGSITIIENYDFIKIFNKIEESMLNKKYDLISISIWNEVKDKLKNILKLGEFLSNKYDIVITNPPYLGRKNCSILLNNYLDKNYPNSKMDLFSAFIEKTINICKDNGNVALMTPFTWLYLSSYRVLRKFVINSMKFESILNPYEGFFNDAAVTICSFVLRKTSNNIVAKNLLLTQNNKIEIINEIENKKFLIIPENRFVFDINDKLLELYNKKKIEEVFKPRQGMATTNNDLFLRKWYEVIINKIGFDMKNEEEALKSQRKWFPYNKGGGKRKWYGNNEYVVNFENNGKTIADYIDNFSNSRVKSNGRIINREYYFRKSITWSDICGNSFSARACKNGFIFDVKGSSGFTNDNDYLYILSLLNSKVSVKLLNMLNPTITTQVGNLKNIPYIYDNSYIDKIDMMAQENIDISKKDWDAFETSWDFKSHPLILERKKAKDEIDQEKSYKIFDCFKHWQTSTKIAFEKLKENEECINRVFINVYGLNDELTPDVDDKDIIIRKADKLREIKSLISYAVGCMFGRYSLDKDGLIYAGGDFDNVYQKYKKTDSDWAGSSLSNYKYLNDNGNEIELSFEVDNDNIIPITDEAYFDDDIVQRFKQFIEVSFGKETLNENLNFIAEALGKKGTETSEETIRRYFVNDFFNDHCKMYQKRPIYWLLDSGKKNGFKALIYMHRYNENLIPKARLDYLHRVQTTYEKLLSDINYKLTTNLSMVDKKDAQKRQADLNAKLQEIKEYDEKIAHIANQRISIDLDDGVKVNYEKFKDILAKIK